MKRKPLMNTILPEWVITSISKRLLIFHIPSDTPSFSLSLAHFPKIKSILLPHLQNLRSYLHLGSTVYLQYTLFYFSIATYHRPRLK